MTSCNPFNGPRNIDWKEEWKANGKALKKLTGEIKQNKDGKNKIGNNSFPSSFSYPFDDGFTIGHQNRDIIIDTSSMSVRYYVDRGLADHFSAFIYTKDSSEIKELDENVQNGGNDYKIEDHGYMIND